MSDIKVGDLVYVKLPRVCCGHAGAVGLVFRVQEVKIFGPPIRWLCIYCNSSGMFAKEYQYARFGGDYFPFGVLKKIDPPAVGKSTESKEELTA